MCGIFFYKTKKITDEYKKVIKENFEKIRHRGPDDTEFVLDRDMCIGFHRLAINGISEKGNQPFVYEGGYVICNGEIYNWRQLNKRYKLGLEDDDSDCAVLMPLYKKVGLEKMVELLDGVFAFVIVDGGDIMAARDPIGVRPLFWGCGQSIGFCSEAKGLVNLMDVEPFPAGSYWSLKDGYPRRYFRIDEWRDDGPNPYLSLMGEKAVSKAVRDVLVGAVRKRMLSERPIGCLLSGGLDSSLVASILQREMGEKRLNTYSIGFKGSPDLEAAKKVAEHIGSNHHEVLMDWKEVEARLPEIIMYLETYDTTTIRASVGMFFVSEYIKKNTDDIVIFSGEGADELCQGYLYFHRQPSVMMGQMESMRLMDNLYMYDVLRADRTTAAHGLELRVPFLDKEFMKLIVSLRGEIVAPRKGMEKWLIRSAFGRSGLLPDEILWRKKEAFSDGVSSEKNNWIDKIRKLARSMVDEKELESNIYKHCSPRTVEELYYRKIFEAFYPNGENWIKEYWMPKWSPETMDPSARTLNTYHMRQQNNFLQDGT